MAAPVSDFLRGKYNSGEPSAMFAAIRKWEHYLNCFNLNHGADLLVDRLSMLYRPFAIYGDYRPWRDEAVDALSKALRDGESNVELWYIDQPNTAKKKNEHNPRFEVIVTAYSFLPIVFYYLQKIEEWRYAFQSCKVCGKHFLARNRHYGLCSDKCRKQQAISAKRAFDEKAKDDRLEQLDESAYYYWYNRLRRLRKTANPDRAAAFKIEFDAFRKEAVKRKAAVRQGKLLQNEFTDWLKQQQNEADRLMEVNPKLDSPPS